MKKIILLISFLLFSSPAFAATKTICASGCDFTTCAGWVSYLQGLTGGTGVLAAPEILEVHESVADKCLLTGAITTSAINYAEIKAWSTCKHAGLYVAGKCEITSSDANFTLYSTLNYLRITDMIISNTRTTGGGNAGKGAFFENMGTGEYRVTNSIFRKTGGGTDPNNRGLDVTVDGTGTFKLVVVNSVFYDWLQFGLKADLRANDTGVIYGNTSYGNGVGFQITCDNGSPNVLRLKDNIGDSNTVGDFVMTDGAACGTESRADNLSSDATGTSGDTAKNPTYVNEAGRDFTLSSASTDAKDAGTDLSADGDYAFSTDIKGTTRPQGASWDIGASEAISSSTSAVTILDALGEL